MGLSEATTEGIELHSWWLPMGSSTESSIVSMGDRIAYLASDLADVLRVGLLSWRDAGLALPQTFGSLKLSFREYERMEASQQRETMLAAGIRNAFTDDVIHTTISTGYVGVSPHIQAAMMELRSFTALFTFQNPMHLEWQRQITDMTEGLILAHAQDFRGAGMGEAEALRAGLDALSSLTEVRTFNLAQMRLGMDVSSIRRGPKLTPARVGVDSPRKANTKVKASLSLTHLVGSPMQVEGPNGLRSPLTAVEALSVLGLATTRSSENHRSYGLAARSPEGEGAVCFVPDPDHPNHQEFVDRLTEGIGSQFADSLLRYKELTQTHSLAPANAAFVASFQRLLASSDDSDIYRPRPSSPDAARAYDAAVVQAERNYCGARMLDHAQRKGREWSAEAVQAGAEFATPSLGRSGPRSTSSGLSGLSL